MTNINSFDLLKAIYVIIFWWYWWYIAKIWFSSCSVKITLHLFDFTVNRKGIFPSGSKQTTNQSIIYGTEMYIVDSRTIFSLLIINKLICHGNLADMQNSSLISRFPNIPQFYKYIIERELPSTMEISTTLHSVVNATSQRAWRHFFKRDLKLIISCFYTCHLIHRNI